MQNKAKNLFYEAFCAFLISLCVIPGYQLLGNLMLQFVATAVCCLVCLFVFDLLKIKAAVISHAIIAMTVFWTCFALYRQISLHISTADFSIKWLHLFYYDRPAMLFVVMFVCIIYFIVKLLIKHKNTDYIADYSRFIKNTTVCFIIYYIIILIYCFIMVRSKSAERPVPNLIPFKMITETFSSGYLDYELFFLFLGNIFIFLPLGIFVPAVKTNKTFLLLFPAALSIGIEVSQYFIGNGHPDVDDVILNILGFYLGILFRIIVDSILKKASKGKLRSFFIFSKNTADTHINQYS